MKLILLSSLILSMNADISFHQDTLKKLGIDYPDSFLKMNQLITKDQLKCPTLNVVDPLGKVCIEAKNDFQRSLGFGDHCVRTSTLLPEQFMSNINDWGVGTLPSITADRDVYAKFKCIQQAIVTCTVEKINDATTDIPTCEVLDPKHDLNCSEIAALSDVTASGLVCKTGFFYIRLVGVKVAHAGKKIEILLTDDSTQPLLP